jgi:hypothetical protein
MNTGDANKFSDLDDESVCDIYAMCIAAQKLFRGGTVSVSKREEEAMNAGTDLITHEMHRRGLTGRVEQPDLESAEIAIMGALAHAARRTGGSATLARVPTTDSTAGTLHGITIINPGRELMRAAPAFVTVIYLRLQCKPVKQLF